MKLSNSSCPFLPSSVSGEIENAWLKLKAIVYLSIQTFASLLWDLKQSVSFSEGPQHGETVSSDTLDIPYLPHTLILRDFMNIAISHRII